jgi:fibro-slime domain-containing protein
MRSVFGWLVAGLLVWDFLLVSGCGSPSGSTPPSQSFGGSGGNAGSSSVVDNGGLGFKPNSGGKGGVSGANGASDAGILLCGNSVIDSRESCDDGNTKSGDGCSGFCTLEYGYTCPTPGQPCSIAPYCGDGVKDSNEECDDGNTIPGDCCDANCKMEPNCSCDTPSPPLVPPHQLCASTIICGDRKVTGNESCDDGNTDNGDGCDQYCNIEAGYNCPPAGGPCSIAVNPCGNAQIDPNEECDDGNSDSGDGCSANCKIENGYVCPTPGQKCKLKAYCGDSIVSYTYGETCDDGNAKSGDGCSATCRIEPYWACPTAGSACTYDVQCGDKRVTGPETCDDGNTVSGDGCSSTCQLEPGYACPIVGAQCKPRCGDGKIVAPEQCDDGNTVSGDGCTATCQTEPGYVCNPAPCKKTVCGNGIREGDESCDDGNTLPYDGCSPTCVTEPRCGTTTSAVGACSSACGDGILLQGAGEECDDGNTTSGDGCSKDCKQEPGYVCTSAYDNPPPSLNIPIVIRDFRQYYAATATAAAIGNPDFGTSCCGSITGILQPLLDVNRKPVYNGTDTAPFPATTHGKTAFDQWYRDVTGVTITFYQSLTLTQKSPGLYSMDTQTDQPWITIDPANPGFYPIDKLGWGACDAWGNGCNEWLSHNYLFTSELRYWFEYKGGEVLNFSGDDDVWVFINGTLAVDLGGVHGREVGSVQLNATDGTGIVGYGDPPYTSSSVDFKLKIGSVYEAVVFQAERWCCGSNYWLTLANFLAGKSSCSPICGDGILTGNEACDLGKDAQGVSLNTGAYGGCTSSCQLAPFCGDGILQKQYGEQCDDGSNSTPYGTQSGCGRGCVIAPSCGDGKLDANYGETCDKGTANSAASYGPGGCTDQCQTAPFCGDGFLNLQEQCDDGQNNGGPSSACDTTCHIKCGNGQLDPGEQCDLGTSGNTGACGVCRSNCKLGPYCGDGVKDTACGETCDDGKNDGSYGTCTPTCQLAIRCGDGHLDVDEQCDDGSNNGSASSQCDSHCKFKCGNGVVDPGEQCDLGSANSASAYGPGLCTNLCLIAPYCGDGIINGTEECDGPLQCTAQCIAVIQH